MHAWEAIQDSLEYIEEHLSASLNIEELSKKVHLSQYYFQRLFSRLVGKPVNEYIKTRRVAKAKTLLKNKDLRILDIALASGFSSHEALSKAFKEIYQVTPSEYRTSDMILNDYLKPNLLLNYTLIDENVPLIVDDMILEVRKEEHVDEVMYSGFRKIIDPDEMNKIGQNTLVLLWDKFLSAIDSMEHLKKGGINIDYFSMSDIPGNVSYFVGGEADQAVSSYDQILTPAGNYYVCAFEAENFEYLANDALYKANKYFFETWLVHHGIGMETMEPFVIQKYFNIETAPKIEIWIKPVLT